MTDVRTCPKCGSHEVGGVEYSYDSPQHYDGVSEWHCMECHTRWGRWSGKILGEHEVEEIFGGGKQRKTV